MRHIRGIKAWYPAFHLGCGPAAVECELSVVEANGRRYLRTPFAMVDAHADDEPERQIGRGYYATAADCLAYLAAEYPWAKHAEPVMGALMDARHHHGDIVGPSRVADKAGVSTDGLYKLARGHKSYTLKAVRAACKAIAEGQS